MTRWQKFGWALGYTLLTALMALEFVTTNTLFTMLGASSFYLCFFIGAFTEITWLGDVMVGVWLLVAAGLVIAPLCAAFRRYWPLYVLMGIDTFGRVLAIVNNILEGNDTMLGTIVLGLLLSIATLAAAVCALRLPEPGRTEKSAATPCKSAAGDV